MKFLVLIAMLLAVIATTATWWQERHIPAAIEVAAHSQDPRAALNRCARERRHTYLFLKHSDVDAACESAVSTALETALQNHEFVLAAALLQNIGADPVARALATTLPARHVAWARELLHQGDLTTLRRELDTMRSLYAEDAALIESASELDMQYQVALAERRLADGDVYGVVKAVLALPVEAPLSLRAAAERYGQAALRTATANTFDHGDYPGLYRQLAAFSKALQSHAALQREVVRLQDAYDQQIFGMVGTLHATHLTPAIQTETASGKSQGILKLHNSDTYALKVVLRGAEAKELDIDPRSEKVVDLAPGAYVLLVKAVAAPDTAFGFLDIGAKGYEQEVRVATSPVRSKAAAHPTA